MSEQNPNYVPVDWPDETAPSGKGFQGQRADFVVMDEAERINTEALLNAATVLEEETDYCPRRGGQDDDHTLSCLMRITPEDSDPARETVTLNSNGDPIKVGDRVHHIADVNQSDRDTGVVRYIGPVEIHGVTVENGAGVQWGDSEKQESHHVDLLTVLL